MVGLITNVRRNSNYGYSIIHEETKQANFFFVFNLNEDFNVGDKVSFEENLIGNTKNQIAAAKNIIKIME
jgi:hypothetical protein